MSDILYPKPPPPWELEPWYSRHVGAMTREGLHSKADIAEQLAWRDQRIAFLEAAVEAANGTTEQANALNSRMLAQFTRIRGAAGPVRKFAGSADLHESHPVWYLLRAIDDGSER